MDNSHDWVRIKAVMIVVSFSKWVVMWNLWRLRFVRDVVIHLYKGV